MRFAGLVCFFACGLLLVGCQSPRARKPLPENPVGVVAIDGVPHARGSLFVDEWTGRLDNSVDLSVAYPETFGRSHTYLALSGGGPFGAYGAGLMNGWSARGDRPEFTVVTGVSTGALASPFVFLGRAYDKALKDIYTNVSLGDIVAEKDLLSTFFTDSFVSTKPLRSLVETHVTDELVAAIAVEHGKGRRLLIVTCNIDTGRLVLWNIGRIASSSRENRTVLIQDILMAAAAVPVVFPPVPIEVRYDAIKGEEISGIYDELHVDAGLITSTYLFYPEIDWDRLIANMALPAKPVIYVIGNKTFGPDWNPPERNTVDIAKRSFEVLIRNHGLSDVYRLFLASQRYEMPFFFSAVPDYFDERQRYPFEQSFMQKLYEVGFAEGFNGTAWQSVPPGLEDLFPSDAEPTPEPTVLAREE